jgi:hypothetical protein
MHTDRQNAKRVDRALRRAMTIPSGLGNGRSQSLEQIPPTGNPEPGVAEPARERWGVSPRSGFPGDNAGSHRLFRPALFAD